VGSGGIIWKVFILEKLCRKKIQQNVAVKKGNQILSIKKIQTNLLAQKKGGGQKKEEKSSR
jgi:hypothetical protein